MFKVEPRGKLQDMDRTGTFFLGLALGALAALGIKKLIDSKELSLENLEDSIEEKLDALEGHFNEPAYN